MNNEWGTFTGRLLWAMKRAGRTNQSELARAVGVKPQSIQYLLRTEAGAQGSKYTPALAQQLGVSSRWLASGDGPPDQIDVLGPHAESKAAAVYAIASGMRARVTGTVRVSGTGDVERIDLPEGDSDGHVLMPLHAPGAYALRVKGNALAPYAKDGQYLLLDTEGEWHPEENLLITLADGRTVLRELLLVRADTLVVLPLHGGQPEALERAVIQSVVPVVCAVPRSLWRPEAS